MEPISSSIGFMGDHHRQFSTEPFSSSSSPSPSPPRPVIGERPTTSIQLDLRSITNGPVAVSVKDPVRISSDPVVRPVGATSTLAGSTSSAKISSDKSSGVVRYRDCLRNHAASVGGHVVDGCGEFMPGAEPEALKCSVCGCHRSFHRKETDGLTGTVPPPPYYYHQFSNGGSGAQRRNNGTPPTPLFALPPPHFHSHQIPYNPTPVTAFSGGAVGETTTESSSEDLDAQTPLASNRGDKRQQQERGYVQVLPPPPSVLSRKRFRTKFTSVQKEKMLGFAESVGWRMHRKDDVAVERFCAEIGVSRQVFKVWMHNNKHVSSSTERSPAVTGGEVQVEKPEIRDDVSHHHEHQQQQHHQMRVERREEM